MAKAVFARKGNVVNYKAGSDVGYLDIVPFAGCIGVAEMDIAKGDVGSVSIAGAYRLPKAAGAIKAGAIVYYDTNGNNIVAASGEKTVEAGIALEDAASDAVTVVVRIG
ncbi:DUF2190 family protein [uncultured Megasphaera sp.]|uniref:DUF2190 family protein n=1 Tax=uncultured Megasphaera sp. TaxID=165188 RepID=UPI00266BAD01|nr:DUF2190 family protein [uncultured Megasphaera sp.]